VASEIWYSKVDGVFVAGVVEVFGLARLLGSGVDVRAKLISVSDAEPVVEFIGRLACASWSVG